MWYFYDYKSKFCPSTMQQPVCSLWKLLFWPVWSCPLHVGSAAFWHRGLPDMTQIVRQAQHAAAVEACELGQHRSILLLQTEEASWSSSKTFQPNIKEAQLTQFPVSLIRMIENLNISHSNFKSSSAMLCARDARFHSSLGQKNMLCIELKLEANLWKNICCDVYLNCL